MSSNEITNDLMKGLLFNLELGNAIKLASLLHSDKEILKLFEERRNLHESWKETRDGKPQTIESSKALHEKAVAIDVWSKKHKEANKLFVLQKSFFRC